MSPSGVSTVGGQDHFCFLLPIRISFIQPDSQGRIRAGRPGLSLSYDPKKISRVWVEFAISLN